MDFRSSEVSIVVGRVLYAPERMDTFPTSENMIATDIRDMASP